MLYFLNTLYFDEEISNERRHTGTVTNEPLALILDYNISIFFFTWALFDAFSSIIDTTLMKTVSKVERFENARNQFLLWTGKNGSFKNFRSFVDGRRKRIKKFAFLYENELVWEGENKNGNTCGVENIFASFSLR